MRSRKSRAKHVWLTTAAGALGGLAGAWTMNQFQSVLAKLNPPKQPAPPPSREQPPGEQKEPATLKAGERIAEAVTGHALTPEQKKITEPLVHYGFGTLAGAIYGALTAKAPAARSGAGTVYGAGVWLLADEIAVPAAGLSGPNRETPWPQHLQALAAHLVYGMTVEGVRRLAAKAGMA